MRIAITLALTAFSSLLFGLAFPPLGWKFLAWVCLAPFFVALRSASLPIVGLLVTLWCVLTAAMLGEWMLDAVSSYFQQPRAIGVAFFTGIVMTMAVPYYLAFAVAYRALARCSVLVLPFLGAAAWVGAELGRGRLFTGTGFFIGNPWGLLGYSQVGSDTLVQIASVTGVYGITFVLVTVNVAFAELALAWLAGSSPRRSAAALGFSVIPALCALGFGHAILRGVEEPSTPSTPIAIVQANLALSRGWRREFYGLNLKTYLRLTRDVLEGPDPPAIVFWPEAAMTFLLDEEPQFREAIGRVLSRGPSELVSGAPRRADATSFMNSIYLLSPAGRILAHYDKQYLVPFAEYSVFSKLGIVRRDFGRVREFRPGAPTPPLPTRAGPAGIVTCNEAMLPEVVAERVAQGAAYLVNPSNDTWIPNEKFAAQQFDIVALRAIEQRRYLVRASTSGPSAIIDPWGRVLARTEPFTRDVLQGRIRARTGRSPYGRVGDLFALLCLAAVALGLMLRPHAARHRL